MANDWNIPEWLEKKVRTRDKFCVFCHTKLRPYPHTKGTPSDKGTFEHLDNNEHNISEKNIAMCCNSCNSSKKQQKILVWFKGDYCQKWKINKKSVASIVKKFIHE